MPVTLLIHSRYGFTGVYRPHVPLLAEVSAARTPTEDVPMELLVRPYSTAPPYRLSCTRNTGPPLSPSQVSRDALPKPPHMVPLGRLVDLPMHVR